MSLPILSLLRTVKLAWTCDVVQETSAEGDPQFRKFSKRRQLTCPPADHDLLTRLVPYAARMHRRFAVGRDGKTAHERNVGRRAVPLLAQFGERVWWMPLQPSNRRLGPLDSRLEQGTCLGPMDGSNTVLIGTASGVVKTRTIKRLPPGERWAGSLLDEALGSELTPIALEDDGGRVGIRAPVLQPHEAIPWYLNFDKCDERHCAEPTLSGLDTETIALDVPTQEQVVCRSRMEAFLVTIIEGHMRLERARERFAQFSEELGVMESSRKRHRPEGERGATSCAAQGREQQ